MPSLPAMQAIGEESWTIQLRFANGGLSTVNYVCGSQQGFVGETVDILGGGRSAAISGFRKLTLNDGHRARSTSLLQTDLGQKAMLQAMMAQFARSRERSITPTVSSPRPERCSPPIARSASAVSCSWGRAIHMP